MLESHKTGCEGCGYKIAALEYGFVNCLIYNGKISIVETDCPRHRCGHCPERPKIETAIQEPKLIIQVQKTWGDV